MIHRPSTAYLMTHMRPIWDPSLLRICSQSRFLISGNHGSEFPSGTIGISWVTALIQFLFDSQTQCRDTVKVAGYTLCVMRAICEEKSASWTTSKLEYILTLLAIRSFSVNKFSEHFQKSVNANFSFGDARSYRLEERSHASQCGNRSESTSIYCAHFTHFRRFHA